jgi:hypothetical protein
LREGEAEKNGELEIHIDEPQIIVNARGTRLTITYQLSSDGQSLVEQPFWTGGDQKAAISLNEFRRTAWLAARRKAHEIGWLKAASDSSDDRTLDLAALRPPQWAGQA